ncbi:hypothetical protein QUA74_10660 [Microcoleus sp. LAD1_D3]|uniref:hypothetical protein n=1 Tax=Microcoleus sp. LAD1_D3 TaxID=2819365 RepID=UPI002FD3FC8A
MQRINFGGIQAEVLALSPHQSYFIFRLSDRIALKGIYTSQFTWDETTDNLTGFLSKRFVLYVGVYTYPEAEVIKDKITQAGGTPNRDVFVSRFVRGYPYEVRAIGLSPEYLVQTLQHYPHPHSA